jgi:CubicO group peptidase (beta-lactamase class C family)
MMTWPLGEYRWDGAGGSFYFVDPQDDMPVLHGAGPDARWTDLNWR